MTRARQPLLRSPSLVCGGELCTSCRLSPPQVQIKSVLVNAGAATAARKLQTRAHKKKRRTMAFAIKRGSRGQKRVPHSGVRVCFCSSPFFLAFHFIFHNITTTGLPEKKKKKNEQELKKAVKRIRSYELDCIRTAARGSASATMRSQQRG